jgi:hypothetical protein
MPLTLTRQQLYDRAWNTPIEALAQELGLSGRGLGKLCDRYDIPVPPEGLVGEEGRWAPSSKLRCRSPTFPPTEGFNLVGPALRWRTSPKTPASTR